MICSAATTTRAILRCPSMVGKSSATEERESLLRLDFLS